MAKKKQTRKPLAKPSRKGTSAVAPVDFAKAVEQAKLDAMKELAYGASHEINNPLANIATRAQTLLRLESDPEKRRMLAAIHAQAMRAHEMIADLMFFARPPQLRREEIDLVALVERVSGELRASAIEQNTNLAVNFSPLPAAGCKSAVAEEGPVSDSPWRGVRGSIALDADPTLLAVAIRALIQNSLEALGSDGRIEITLSANSKHAIISVADTGPGIPPEIHPHIFEPFYSGREAGRGLGFGLSKCWRIVTDHGGQIEIDQNSPVGTRATILLPLVESRQPAH